VVIKQRAFPRAHPGRGNPARAGHRQGWSLGGYFPHLNNKKKLIIKINKHNKKNRYSPPPPT